MHQRHKTGEAEFVRHCSTVTVERPRETKSTQRQLKEDFSQVVGVSPQAIVSMLQCSGTSEVLLEAIDSLLLESEMARHNHLS